MLIPSTEMVVFQKLSKIIEFIKYYNNKLKLDNTKSITNGTKMITLFFKTVVQTGDEPQTQTVQLLTAQSQSETPQQDTKHY